MQAEYSLTDDDLMALGRFQIAHSPVVQERFRTRRWLYPAGLAILALGTYIVGGSPVLSLILLGLALLAFLLFPRYFDWIVERSIQRAVKRDSTPSSLARRRLIVTPEGLQQAQENNESSVTWAMVDSIDSGPAHTFISIDGTYSVVIPRARIEDGSYDAFVKHLHEAYKASLDAAQNNEQKE
jgi:hypothetical protein